MRNLISRVRAGISRATSGFRRRTASSASGARTSGS